MNGKLFFGKINLKKIEKSKLFVSEKTGAVYLDLTIWVNEEPDNYGNHMSLQQSTEKDADKIYLGNGKAYEAKHEEPTDLDFLLC